MPLKQVIILAGGFGTRIKDSIGDLPKCLAPVDGRPFIFYVINFLRSQGIESFIFSLGYKHEAVESYLKEHFSTLNYSCHIEREPLGTGGAIRACCKLATEDSALVANGDSLFKVSIASASELHHQKKAACTLLLKEMTKFSRYGVVELNDNRVVQFREKQFYENGLINAGMYILDLKQFAVKDLPQKFSFETDYLEKEYSSGLLYGFIGKGYFIDIGIPEDYRKACEDLSQPPLDLNSIDKSWTLFLDRDGVINHEKKDDYIRHWKEFRFYKGVPEAFKVFSEKFGRVIVVTNQRGVGRGYMTQAQLHNIHENLEATVRSAGGRIDRIYACTETDSRHPERKPNPGMAFKAFSEFPDIIPGKSIMIGNKPGDMQFGKHAGMYTVFMATTNPQTAFPHPDINARFNSLEEFANAL